MVTIRPLRTHMKTITLPRHFWLGFHRPVLQRQERTAVPHGATHDTKPRAPAVPKTGLWEVSDARFFGIILPNRYQLLFFALLCSVLALPVFLCDTSGQGLWHGLVTLGSLAGFCAFCWIVGMALANTVSPEASSEAKQPDHLRHVAEKTEPRL